jgi:hypothetical protein
VELLFVDESGDNGFASGSTPLFILGGVSIRSDKWKEFFWKIVATKEQISRRFGLIIHELKASDLFTHRGSFFDTKLHLEDTIWIYDRLVDLLCDPAVSLLVGIYSKSEFEQEKYPLSAKHLVRAFTERVWRDYLGKLEDRLLEISERAGYPENAIVYYDANPGHEKYVRRVVRDYAKKYDEKAHFPSAGIVEDVILRDSKTSYPIQLADVLAYSVFQISPQTRSRHPTVTDATAERLQRKIAEMSPNRARGGE